MGALKMKPRDSMPTTASICLSRNGSSMSWIDSWKAPASLSSVVMS